MAVNVFLIFSAVILWRFILGVNKGFSGKAGSMVDIVTAGYSAMVMRGRSIKLSGQSVSVT